MKRARSAPFLTAPEDCVQALDWELWSDGESRGVGEAVPGWDPAMDLLFRRSVAVRPESIREACRLPADAPLRLGAWWTSGNWMRDRTEPIPLGTGPAENHVLTLAVPGDCMSKDLTLNTVVALGSNQSRQPLRPFRAGSALWQDEQKVLLEGGGSRFPMEMVPFSASSGFPSGAAWYLDWNPSELESPFLGAVRLYLNADHPVIAEAVRSPADERSQMVMQTIQFALARQMLRGALHNDEFIARTEPYDADSVGRVLHRLIKSRFKASSPTSLRNELETDADHFEALLQHHLGLFQGLK